MHQSVCLPLCLLNDRRYLNETGHNYCLASTDDTDDIEKVIGSKVKVADDD